MECYLSTSCFGNHYLSEAIKLCHDISPFHVEVSAPHPYQNLEKFKNILNRYRDHGILFTLHNYFPTPKSPFVLNIAASDKTEKNLSKGLINNALNLSKSIGSPLYGIHAGYLAKAKEEENGMFIFENSTTSYREALKNSVELVNRIAPSFTHAGVKLIIENLFPSPTQHHSLFCSISEIKEFMSQVPDTVGVLLDLGHLNVSSTIMDFDRSLFLDEYLKIFDSRLIEVHISENDGLTDQHLPVTKGSWQLETVKLINQLEVPSGIDRIYCLESRNSARHELIESIDLLNNIIA